MAVAALGEEVAAPALGVEAAMASALGWAMRQRWRREREGENRIDREGRESLARFRFSLTQ